VDPSLSEISNGVAAFEDNNWVILEIFPEYAASNTKYYKLLLLLFSWLGYWQEISTSIPF
jgi:hypothetical protein